MASGAKGRGFDPRIAHHLTIIIGFDPGGQKKVMKKWVGPFVSLLLVIVLVYFMAPFQLPAQRESWNSKVKPVPAIFGRMDEDEEKKNEDTQLVQVLKRVQEILDGWLKSLNERIESEDVTRLEVRFLEVLRSFLEWVKGKVDAKIESSKGQKKDNVTYLDFRRGPLPGLMRG